MSDLHFGIWVGAGILIFPEVLMLIFWISGWRRLSKTFDNPDFDGHIIHHISGDIGAVTYGYILVISISSRGIACRLPLLLSLWHKPFFLPWKAMSSSRLGTSWFERVLCLDFLVGRTKVSLRIPDRYAKIVSHANELVSLP